MQKLKLNLDDLCVDSFHTTNRTNEAQGTVEGYNLSKIIYCDDPKTSVASPYSLYCLDSSKDTFCDFELVRQDKTLPDACLTISEYKPLTPLQPIKKG